MNRFNQGYDSVRQWLSSTIEKGWLKQDTFTLLDEVEVVTADKLFSIKKRPLLVAFFGGTGVGKSSLLNRLAGESVANVGAIRPTSHNVTLYLHEDYKDSLHEEALPTEGSRIVYHRDDARRYFAWIDMPDIDSTEQKNREIVNNWLPVVDWLIYVVTPERYQDEQGWKFVQSRGGKHNWLFVMNHWDQGTESQRKDFTSKLSAQGFKDPVVITTSCNPDKKIIDDEFDELERILNASLKKSGLNTLQELANKRQWYFLGKAINSLTSTLQSPTGWAGLKEDWKAFSKKGLDEIQQRLMANAEVVYQHWKAQEEQKKDVLPKLEVTSENISSDGFEGYPFNSVYDQRDSARLKMLKLTLENRFTATGFSTDIVRDNLNNVILESENNYLESIDSQLIKSLRQPGNFFTRLLRKSMRLLQWLLPLGVALWVGYHVLSGFNSGLEGESEFLGVNYLVHSSLMIGLAWLIPWLIRKQFRPSYASAALQGVTKGIEGGHQYSKELLQGCWNDIEDEKNSLLDELLSIKKTYQPEFESANQLPEKYMSLKTRDNR